MIYRNLVLSKVDLENIYNKMNTEKLKIVSLRGSKLGFDNYQDIYFLKENADDIRYIEEKMIFVEKRKNLVLL